MNVRQVTCLAISLTISSFAAAANSPETNTALGELQAVAKYCDEITKGKKIDVKDMMQYLSAGTGGSCPSCSTMVAEAKETKEFRTAYESAFKRLARTDVGPAKQACVAVQKNS